MNGAPIIHREPDWTDWRLYFGVPMLLGKQLVAHLSPVYEVQTSVQRQPQGMAIARAVLPVGMLGIVKCIAPTGSGWVWVGDLPDRVRRELASGIRQADALIQEMRAQDAGLVLAKPGAQ